MMSRILGSAPWGERDNGHPGQREDGGSHMMSDPADPPEPEGLVNEQRPLPDHEAPPTLPDVPAGRSRVILRDAASRTALKAVDLNLDLGTPLDLRRVLDSLNKAGGKALWLKAAMYMVNEGAKEEPIWTFVRQAYKRTGLEVAFDLDARGLTCAVLRELEPKDPKCARGAFRCWSRKAEPTRRRLSFHPKVLTTCIEMPSGRLVKLALVGSGNLTAGGMADNHELGVLHARSASLEQARPADEMASPNPTRRSGWPEADRALEHLWKEAQPLTETDIENLPDNKERQREAQALDRFSPWTLRDFQEEAVQAVLDGWVGAKQRNRPVRRRGGSRQESFQGGLLVLPPGAGKTVVAVEAIWRLFRRKTVNKVMWLAPKPVLARQALAHWSRRFLAESTLPDAVAGVLWRAEEGRPVFLGKDGLFQEPVDPGQLKKAGRLILFIGKDFADHRPDGGEVGERAKLLSSLKLDLIVADEAHHAHGGRWAKLLSDLRPRMEVGGRSS